MPKNSAIEHVVFDFDFTISARHFHENCHNILQDIKASPRYKNEPWFDKLPQDYRNNPNLFENCPEVIPIIWKTLQELRLDAPAGTAAEWRDIFKTLIDGGYQVSIASFSAFKPVLELFLKEKIFENKDEDYLKKIRMEVWYPTERLNKNQHLDRILTDTNQNKEIKETDVFLSEEKRKEEYKKIILVDDSEYNVQAVKDLTNNDVSIVHLPTTENDQGNPINPSTIKNHLNKNLGLDFVTDKLKEKKLQQKPAQEEKKQIPAWAQKLTAEIEKINQDSKMGSLSVANMQKIKSLAQAAGVTNFPDYFNEENIKFIGTSEITAKYSDTTETMLIYVGTTHMQKELSFTITQEEYLKHQQIPPKYLAEVKDAWRPSINSVEEANAELEKNEVGIGTYLIRPSSQPSTQDTSFITLSVKKQTGVSHYRLEVKEDGIYRKGGKRPIHLTSQNIAYLLQLGKDMDHFMEKPKPATQMKPGEIIIYPTVDEYGQNVFQAIQSLDSNTQKVKTFIPQNNGTLQNNGTFKLQKDKGSLVEVEVTSISDYMKQSMPLPKWVIELEAHSKKFISKARENGSRKLNKLSMDEFNHLFAGPGEDPIITTDKYKNTLQSITITFDPQKNKVNIEVEGAYVNHKKIVTLTEDDFNTRISVLGPAPKTPNSDLTNSTPEKKKLSFGFSLFKTVDKVIESYHQKKWEKALEKGITDPITLLKKCVDFNPKKTIEYIHGNNHSEKGEIRKILAQQESFKNVPPEQKQTDTLEKIKLKLGDNIKNSSVRTLLNVIDSHQAKTSIRNA